MADNGRDLHWTSGGWKPYNVFADAPEGFTDVEEYMESQGWETFLDLGSGETLGFSLRVLVRHVKDAHPEYLVEVGGASTVAPFLKVDDLPTAMDLLARWAPALHAHSVAHLVDDLSTGMIEHTGIAETVAARAAWGVEARMPVMARQRANLDRPKHLD